MIWGWRRSVALTVRLRCVRCALSVHLRCAYSAYGAPVCCAVCCNKHYGFVLFFVTHRGKKQRKHVSESWKSTSKTVWAMFLFFYQIVKNINTCLNHQNQILMVFFRPWSNMYALWGCHPCRGGPLHLRCTVRPPLGKFHPAAWLAKLCFVLCRSACFLVTLMVQSRVF